MDDGDDDQFNGAYDDSRDGGQNGGDDADRSDYDCFECSLYLLC